MIQVFPLVTAVEKDINFSIVFDVEDKKLFEGDLLLKYVGEDGRFAQHYPEKQGLFQDVPLFGLNKKVRELCFSFTFSYEGEHHFFLFREGEEKAFYSFNIYSLKHDLLALPPFKGDFHMHSNQSDGVDAPVVVAASCRKIGLDFMALTDHGKMTPSRQVMEWISQFETDLRCYAGEEVHPPDNPVHIINFGGNVSINDFMQQKEDLYKEEVNREKEAVNLEQDDLTYQAASSRWAFKKIRETGGVGMYCHPFWRWNERFYVSRPLHENIMESGDFDILEVIGGYHPFELESNALAVALYEQYRANGKVYPAAGVSDSHDCSGELFGWYYSLVFARSSDFDDLADSMGRGDILAVSAVPGEFPRLTGPFRLVKYGYFLLREFFPKHDDLCRKEGELLLLLADSDKLKDEEIKKIADELAALKGSVPAFRKRCFFGLRD